MTLSLLHTHTNTKISETIENAEGKGGLRLGGWGSFAGMECKLVGTEPVRTVMAT